MPKQQNFKSKMRNLVLSVRLKAESASTSKKVIFPSKKDSQKSHSQANPKMWMKITLSGHKKPSSIAQYPLL